MFNLSLVAGLSAELTAELNVELMELSKSNNLLHFCVFSSKCEQLKVIIDASRLGENYSEFPSRIIVNVILAHMSMLGCCTTA